MITVGPNGRTLAQLSSELREEMLVDRDAGVDWLHRCVRLRCDLLR